MLTEVMKERDHRLEDVDKEILHEEEIFMKETDLYIELLNIKRLLSFEIAKVKQRKFNEFETKREYEITEIHIAIQNFMDEMSEFSSLKKEENYLLDENKKMFSYSTPGSFNRSIDEMDLGSKLYKIKLEKEKLFKLATKQLGYTEKLAELSSRQYHDELGSSIMIDLEISVLERKIEEKKLTLDAHLQSLKERKIAICKEYANCDLQQA